MPNKNGNYVVPDNIQGTLTWYSPTFYGRGRLALREPRSAVWRSAQKFHYLKGRKYEIEPGCVAKNGKTAVEHADGLKWLLTPQRLALLANPYSQLSLCQVGHE